MRTAERTLAGLFHLQMKVLPKKGLADLEFVQAPEMRRLLPLTAISIDPAA